MKNDNQFQYARNQNLQEVTLLQAEMTDFTYGKHAHEEFSFGVTLTGRQDFFCNGGFHRSLPGNTIIFNPDDVHDGHSGVEDKLQYRMLYIHPRELEPMLETAGMKNATGFRMPDNLIVDAPMRQALLNLSSLINQPDSDRLQLDCELYQLAARIAQHCGDYEPNDVSRRADRLILQARDYIQDHLLDELSLEQISEQANLSKYHFLRLFRQQFGITPHQYLMNCRINAARKSLEQGRSLDDVVYDYGFSDLSHFNRRFKPIYGTTPKRYQQLFVS